MTTEERIWQRLKAAGYNDFGIAELQMEHRVTAMDLLVTIGV